MNRILFYKFLLESMMDRKVMDQIQHEQKHFQNNNLLLFDRLFELKKKHTKDNDW